MSTALSQHQVEIEENLAAWRAKPLLQNIYAGFYHRILAEIDHTFPGKIVELGSGIGNLKEHLPSALATDLFPNSWLDMQCDAYDMPFEKESVSHLVLFDVFHHLQRPSAFFREARRVLVREGRVIIFDPYISLFSYPVYGLLHHEPIGYGKPIDWADREPQPQTYYAAQGNATRLFFKGERTGWPAGWRVRRTQAFSAFHYLFSGGYSKPSLYPIAWLPAIRRVDRWLSRWPRWWGARCLVSLELT